MQISLVAGGTKRETGEVMGVARCPEENLFIKQRILEYKEVYVLFLMGSQEAVLLTLIS